MLVEHTQSIFRGRKYNLLCTNCIKCKACTALHRRLYSAQIEQQDHLPPTPLPAKHDTKACSSSQAANLFNYFSSFSLHDISVKQDAEAIMRTPQVHNPRWENSFDNICYKKTPKSIWRQFCVIRISKSVKFLVWDSQKRNSLGISNKK